MYLLQKNFDSHFFKAVDTDSINNLGTCPVSNMKYLPVNIVAFLVWQRHIDDERNTLDVDAPRRHVGADKEAHVLVFERVQVGLALCWFAVTVQTHTAKHSSLWILYTTVINYNRLASRQIEHSS